jgi:hypothetical protein
MIPKTETEKVLMINKAAELIAEIAYVNDLDIEICMPLILSMAEDKLKIVKEYDQEHMVKN